MNAFLAVWLLAACFRAESQDWKNYLDSAKDHIAMNNSDAALAFLLKSRFSVPHDSLVSDTYLFIVTEAGRLYKNKSRYREAGPLYLEMLNITMKKYGKGSEKYAAASFETGKLCYELRKFNEAIQYCTGALHIWEALSAKESAGYASCCNMLGIICNDSGEYDNAIAYHAAARNIREKLFTKESGPYAQSCNNLAAIYWNMGKYEMAEPLALEAKLIRGRLTSVARSDYAISCTNLANIYRDMGKYEQAEVLYTEAKNIREKAFSKDHQLYASSCNILADLYYFMKKYRAAESLYIEAKDIREKIAGTDSYVYGQSCNNLASLYRETGRYEEAEMLALEAMRIWSNIPSISPGQHAINYNNLGDIYLAMKKYEKAEIYFLKARKIWEENPGKDHPYYIDNSLELAKMYWATNHISKAAALYEDAFRSQGKLIDNFFTFTSENEKQQYIQNISGTEDEYQSFYYAVHLSGNKGEPYLISLAKRNLILSSSQQLRQTVFDTKDTSLLTKYNEWNGIKRQLASFYSKGSSMSDQYVAALSARADSLEKVLSRLSVGFGKRKKTIPGWEAIRQKLRPGEAAIEFIEFSYFNGVRYTDSVYYEALLLRKDQPVPEPVFLFEKKQLDSLLQPVGNGSSSVNALYTRGSKIRVDSGITRSAYNLIWKPLEKKLEGIRTIYFAPAGLLNRISFAALPVSNSQVLSDRYHLVQLSSTASIASDDAVPQVTARDRIVLLGGISYGSGNDFPYLPGTKREIAGIDSIARRYGFRTHAISGTDAREDSVKNLNDMASPGILHIATHGFFFPGPGSAKDSPALADSSAGYQFRLSGNTLMRSGLLMANANRGWQGLGTGAADDGILTAYEISNLYLPATKLVVLSACETALGDIQGSEGVFGLQRAFKMAGVKAMIMSLWKVPDEETALFMLLFYKKLFQGKTIDNAFYETRESMKKDYRKEPYKWAAWVLVK
jgi:CHAT domain-containing protein/tetratricopeptide (TPR) repeat protein